MTLNRHWEKETTLISLENIFKEHLEISLDILKDKLFGIQALNNTVHVTISKCCISVDAMQAARMHKNA